MIHLFLQCKTLKLKYINCIGDETRETIILYRVFPVFPGRGVAFPHVATERNKIETWFLFHQKEHKFLLKIGIFKYFFKLPRRREKRDCDETEWTTPNLTVWAS